jgi:hypothetical protein
MGRTRKYNRKNNKNRRRKHKKTYKGGEQDTNEKKTFLSVIGDKAKAVLEKGTDLGLHMVGLKRVNEPPPPPTPTPEVPAEKKEPNAAVQAMSNATENLTDAANNVVNETLKFTEKLNNPETVKRLEEGLDNVAKIAGPLTDKLADKVTDVFEKESPKIAAAGTDMLVSAANALPGVGAVISLGREINDVQKIAESAIETTKELVETVNDATVEGVKQYEQIKNSANNLQVPTLTNNMNVVPTTLKDNTLIQRGGRNLRTLQRAGATINNRVHRSINEFLKTRKINKKVRFNI